MLIGGLNLPVDLSNDVIHSKSGAIQVIPVPYNPTPDDSVMTTRHVNAVVDADNDRHQPGEQSQDLVGKYGAMAVRVPSDQRVPCNDEDMSTL
jgi:hypothetical protein